MQEYELLGDFAGSFESRHPSSAGLFPMAAGGAAQDPEAEPAGSTISNSELKHTLIKTLMTKRAKLQGFYQKKRQLKLVEKLQKQQERALGQPEAKPLSEDSIRCTLQAWDRKSK